MNQIWLLFIEFLLIGAFTVGGGLATIPYLINLIDKYDWYTQSMLMDMIAISESTPGPIGVNMATYVGYIVEGIPGALVASVAVMMTGVIFMMIVGSQLEKFKSNPILKKIFYGLRPTIAALIAYAAYTMIVAIVGEMGMVATEIISTVSLFILTLVLMTKTKLSPITIIGIAAMVSLFVTF